MWNHLYNLNNSYINSITDLKPIFDYLLEMNVLSAYSWFICVISTLKLNNEIQQEGMGSTWAGKLFVMSQMVLNENSL